MNRLPGKKPADRQRFKSSLAEPFLLTLNGNTVLRREVVKGSERSDKVCVGEEPSRDPGGEKVMESLSPFFYRDSKLGCNFGVMGSLAGLYHPPHDEMEGSVNIDRFTHEIPS
ncbi:MAG: hypothetical protein A2V86_06475 [Deltaproteobacteria bacterium RBG_16_49_23]|nr:MAG: hypothetical protein A2V86_06475 [Deltaproteobacteria bacterium RBG_16_49_23]